jgi:hypothetical protein
LGKWNDLENARIPSKEDELKATEAWKENCMYKVISPTFTTKKRKFSIDEISVAVRETLELKSRSSKQSFLISTCTMFF